MGDVAVDPDLRLWHVGLHHELFHTGPTVCLNDDCLAGDGIGRRLVSVARDVAGAFWEMAETHRQRGR